MKLKNFLMEEMDNYQISRKLGWIIKQNCADFLKIRGASIYSYLFRGENIPASSIIKTDSSVELTPIEVRKNRNPKDTKIELHNLLDAGFSSWFGYKARSESIHCTGSRDIARNYGEVHRIFPIGKVTCIWSREIKDLTEIEPSELYSDLDIKKYPNVAAFILYFYLKQNNFNLIESLSINEIKISRRKRNSIHSLRLQFESEFDTMFKFFKFIPDDNWAKRLHANIREKQISSCKKFCSSLLSRKWFGFGPWI